MQNATNNVNASTIAGYGVWWKNGQAFRATYSTASYTLAEAKAHAFEACADFGRGFEVRAFEMLYGKPYSIGRSLRFSER